MDLREEIIETHKMRADLLNWKIILVAAIDAVLGIGDAGLHAPGTSGSDALHYLLCLIPLVCLYTDALCLHENIRIRAIASFLRQCDHRPYSLLISSSSADVGQIRQGGPDPNCGALLERYDGAI